MATKRSAKVIVEDADGEHEIRYYVRSVVRGGKLFSQADAWEACVDREVIVSVPADVSQALYDAGVRCVRYDMGTRVGIVRTQVLATNCGTIEEAIEYMHAAIWAQLAEPGARVANGIVPPTTPWAEHKERE